MRSSPLSAPKGTPLAGCRLRFDDSVSLLEGSVLVGGIPLRLLRLSPAGVKAVQRLFAGEIVREPSTAVLARLLVDGGLAYPEYEDSRYSLDDVTVVIPIQNRLDELVAMLDSLSGVRTVVVDDGSDDPRRLSQIAVSRGASVVHCSPSRGHHNLQ